MTIPPHAPGDQDCRVESHPDRECAHAEGGLGGVPYLGIGLPCGSCGACVCVRCYSGPCPECGGSGEVRKACNQPKQCADYGCYYTGPDRCRGDTKVDPNCNGTGTVPDPEGTRHYADCDATI